MAIAGILVVGIIVTLSTSKFVAKQEQTMAAVALETSKAAAVQKERSLETKSKTEETSSAAVQTEGPKAAETQLETETATPSTEAQAEAPAPQGEVAVSQVLMLAEETDSVPVAPIGEVVSVEETVQSPLKSGNKSAEIAPEADKTDLAAYYKKRLNELDLQVQKMKDSDAEGTTYSMKSNAEKEWKLWDSELNTIYNEILDSLNAEDAKQLVEEEKQWLKMRDAAALEASQKYSGGSLEGVEYTTTLASYTRDRVYDLVNSYMEE